MTHLERFTRVAIRKLSPWSIENMWASRKLAKWSDYCESCEVGVGVPGLDQTLIMWSIRKALHGTGVEVYYSQYFDPSAFNQPLIEVVVPEIDFHYRFDETLAGRGVEVEYGIFIVNVMRGNYENNLEI